MEQPSKREAYHRQVAEKLIKQLEQGTAPWQRPWRDSEVMPFNATTGKAYKGVNILQLMSEGYSDPRWMTYVQAKSIGAQVKAGEKGTLIHYTQYEEQRVKRDADGKPVLDENGQTVKETHKLIRPKNFQSHVFNIEQIDNHNLPPLPPKSQQADWNPIERAEQILAASGANISHLPGNRAFYRPATDSITLPEKSQFPSAETYYDTALHELGHWTGHESRLNRDMKHGFGSQGYAKEELRAEIASMMLAANIGIAHDTEQNAAYVQSWIKVLKDDPQEIYRAAKDAENIQNYVLGLEHKQQLAQEQAQQQQAQQTQPPTVHVSLEPLEPQPLEIPEATQVYADNVKRLQSLLAAHPEQTVQDMQQAARAISENGYNSRPIYNETLPDDWTGELQIVGIARGDNGQIVRADDVGRPHEAYGIYARRGEAAYGEAAWKLIAGAKTPEETQAKVEHIRLIDALAATNPYEQAVTLALIEAERVWNNPRATTEEKEQVKEALDVVRDLADMAGQAQQTETELPLRPEHTEMLAEQAGEAPVPEASPAVKRAAETLNILINDYGWTKQEVDGKPLCVEQDFAIGGVERVHRLRAGYQFDADNLQTVNLSHNNLGITFSTIEEWDGLTVEPHELAAHIHSSAAQYADKKRIHNDLEPRYQTEAERFMPARTEPPAPPPLELPTAAQVAEDNKATLKQLLAAHPEPTGQRLRETAYALQKDGLDSHPVFGQTLPHDWTGEVRVAPSVRDIESGQIIPAEQAGREAEGYGVYARKGQAKEGEQAWQPITASKTQAQAQTRAEQLQLLDALLQSNPYNQAVQLAYIERERVARNPEATDKQREEAKEALKSAQSLAELAELKQQQARQRQNTQEKTAAQNQRHYLKVAFKDREDVKKLGAKWDAEEKLWFIPEGTDKAPFAKWPQTTPEQAKAERAQNAQRASQTQAPRGKAPQTEPAKRQYLSVPIERKDEAKAAGARWDKAVGAWYAGPQADMKALEKFRADTIAIQQELPFRPQEEFAAAMRSIGLIVDGEHPIMDGKTHRIAVEGGKKGAKDGFYVGHLDGRPAGSISNNRTGAKINWKSNATVLTDAQRAKLAVEAAENRAARETEQQQLQEQAAERVSKQWHSLKPITQPTPYLQSKGIGIHQGIKTSQDGKATIIPAFDSDGKHWTTQYIQADGEKRFAKDGRKKGCFHPVGGMEALKSAPVLVIAEGYATAVSLAEGLKHATVAAFDSGNLKDAALALHEKYPNKPIVIAGDDDQKQETQNGRNPGREKAIEAAKAVDGSTVFPIFAPGEQRDKGLSDFNDLAHKSELGMDSLKRQVSAVIGQETQRHQQRRQQQQALADKQEQGMRM